jgi:asparagine synthase (glutamine-hydrolysing)
VKGRFAIVAGENRAALTERLRLRAMRHFTMGGADIFADENVVVSAHPLGPAIVLGTLFHRGDDRRVTELGIVDCHAIADSGGRHLIDNFWGSYVALAEARGQFGAVVVRDPSAQLPLYGWQLDQCTLFFSDFQLALDVVRQKPAFDWDAIAHRLRFPGLRIVSSGLEGVTEIIPGSCISLQTGDATQLWHPWAFVDNAPPDPEALEATLLRCVRAWAGTFSRIDVELSGGLDSSIVAACVAASSCDWRAVTYATDAAEGDERRYARAVALALGVPLDEFVVTVDALDPISLPAYPRIRPGGFGVLGGIDRLLGASSRSAGADAIFSGGGGDNIFCKIRSAGPVADSLAIQGVRGAWRTARDLAELCDTTMWDVGRHSMRQLWRRRQTRWPASDDLLNHKALAAFRGHPWLDQVRDRPGKRAHIANLVGILPFLDGYDRTHEFPMIYPLLTQPVVELCLAVPSWRWIANGRDRAFARDAFARRLPASVIQRRSKGGLRSVMIPAFERSRIPLASLLCDGMLAAQGLVDCDAIKAVLDAPVSSTKTDYVRVFELADVELWVRSIDGLSGLYR